MTNETSSNVESVLAKANELNEQANQVNQASSEARSRKKFVQEDLIKKIATLKEKYPNFDLDLNDKDFDAKLANLIQTQSDEIQAKSNRLQEIIEAQREGDITKLETLLGVELKSDNEAPQLEAAGTALEKKAETPLETPAQSTETASTQTASASTEDAQSSIEPTDSTDTSSEGENAVSAGEAGDVDKLKEMLGKASSGTLGHEKTPTTGQSETPDQPAGQPAEPTEPVEPAKPAEPDTSNEPNFGSFFNN